MILGLRYALIWVRVSLLEDPPPRRSSNRGNEGASLAAFKLWVVALAAVASGVPAFRVADRLKW